MAKETKPRTIPTARSRRNLIITCIIGGIIISICFAMLIGNVLRDLAAGGNTNDTDEVVITEIQEEVETLNSPTKAKEAIVAYYQALADKNVKALRDMGANVAANAMNRGWLNNLDYRIDFEKVKHPDIDAFPQSQGLYAGCTLYKISDFYRNEPTDVIWTNATTMLGAVGWIYYDPINVKWVIADPSIPTGYASPTAENVKRVSANNEAEVELSCPGVYSNGWWAWAEFQVCVTNRSANTPIRISTLKYDNGFTIWGSDSLNAELSPTIERRNVEREVSVLDENGQETGETTTLTEVIESSDKTLNERCVIYRGDVHDFSTDKIGAKPLEVDGNICPVKIAFGDEEIAPIFAVGKADTENLVQQLTDEQIENYDATNNIPKIDIPIDTTTVEQNENANNQQPASILRNSPRSG